MCSGTNQTNLSNNLQRSFSSLFGVNRELGGLPNSQTAALQARAERLHLKVHTNQGQTAAAVQSSIVQEVRGLVVFTLSG